MTLTTVSHATDSSAAFGERTRGQYTPWRHRRKQKSAQACGNQSSTALRVIGRCWVFAWFWLRAAQVTLVSSTLMSSHGWSWASIGADAVQPAFVVGGLLLLMLSLALLTHRLGATVRRGRSLSPPPRSGCAGTTSPLVCARRFQRLQATASMSSGPTVLRYGLAARTATARAAAVHRARGNRWCTAEPHAAGALAGWSNGHRRNPV